MPLYRELSPHKSLKLAFWNITESENELKQMLDISIINMQELDQIHLDIRRKQWLATRVLLKYLLGEQMNVFYDEHGAPYLEKKTTNISISHSGAFVAVGVNAEQRVGVDIQYFNPKIVNIKEKFCGEDELMRFEANVDPFCYLHVVWCLKEAVFKFHRRNVVFKDVLTEDFSVQNPESVFVNLTKDGIKFHHELETLRFGSYFCAYLKQSNSKQN